MVDLFLKRHAEIGMLISDSPSGLVGAALGGTAGVVRSINPVQLAGNTGLRWFVMSTAFFGGSMLDEVFVGWNIETDGDRIISGLREYIVSPILTASQATRFHAYHRAEALGIPYPTHLTIKDLRTARLLDGALSGALGGPMLVIFQEISTGLRYQGRSWRMARAGLTCALITSSLQMIANQSRIIRLNLLAKREANPREQVETEEKSTSEQMLDALRTPMRDAGGENLGEKSLPGRILGTLSTFLPIQKLSDEEYLSALMRKRAEVDKRLAEIENEEKRIYDYATSGNRRL